MEKVPELSQHTLDAQDTEGDLHKRMVSSKSIEVRATNRCQLTVKHIFRARGTS